MDPQPAPSQDLPFEAPAAPPPPAKIGPVTTGERHTSVDVIRGVAVLGILVMNIYAFAMPAAAYSNPLLYGGFEGLNKAVWQFTHVFFELKFMTIFSMLFGAGLILMHDRAEAKGASLRGPYYRRSLWLMFFGAVHAYLLWMGDILWSYGACGLVIYLFRRRSAKTLIIIGSILILIGGGLSIGFGALTGKARSAASEVAELQAAGEEPTEEQTQLAEQWEEMRLMAVPTPEEIEEEIAIHQGGYLGILTERAPKVFWMQTVMLLFFLIWRAAGTMMLGMALMKMGVFTLHCSTGFYRNLVLVGYILGLPLVFVGSQQMVAHEFDYVRYLSTDLLFNYFGSLLVALGHIGLILLIVRSGILSALTARLASVGRMAFTNYLMHSVLCTLLFYGYGAGLFGQLDRAAQMGVVLAIWILQLLYSHWWLSRFRMGPAEWLWRALTYWKRPKLAGGVTSSSAQ